MIAPNLIILWPGSHATIPDGYVRVTSLDGRYAKGAADEANGGATGGAANHSHTSPSHTHALNAHTHTGTLSNCNTGGDTKEGTGDAMGGNHYHTFTTGNPTGGTTNGTALTYGSVSNDPPYYELIFIQAVGFQPIPDGAIVLFNGTTLPDDYDVCDGANATPDLDDLFIKGSTTGANAGGSGGSTTNIHDISHSHTTNSHYHTGTTGVNQNSIRRVSSSPPTDAVAYTGGSNHTHSIQTNVATEPIDAFSGTLETAETVEPEYTKLLAMQNNKGAARVAEPGLIAMFLGAPDELPTGWKLCDGNNDTVDMRDQHLKITKTPGEIGDTGGSNTHTHAAQSHEHTSPAGHKHTDLSSISSHSSQNLSGESPRVQYDDKDDNHSLVGDTSTSTPGYAAANTTADESSNEPPYTTVQFVEFVFLPGGMHPDLL